MGVRGPLSAPKILESRRNAFMIQEQIACMIADRVPAALSMNRKREAPVKQTGALPDLRLTMLYLRERSRLQLKSLPRAKQLPMLVGMLRLHLSRQLWLSKTKTQS